MAARLTSLQQEVNGVGVKPVGNGKGEESGKDKMDIS
jgi:hypothetical protein